MKRRGTFKPKTATALAAMLACGSLAATLSDHGALGFVEQDRFRKVPVVMLVFDEFPVATLMNRRGKVDPHLFPNFAKIQRDSHWFRNTTTPSAFTSRAVPALMTGLYPKNFSETMERSSLFNLLGGSYDIRANEENLGDICPSSACDDPATPATKRLRQRYGHIFPGDRGDKFLRFLGFIRNVDKPRFFFMHLVMPHQPWRYLPTGQAYPQTSPIPGELDPPGKGKEWAKDGWLVTQAYQRHLLQTALLDRQLGILIDRLKDKDIYGRSLLVVMADHGIAYKPGASKRLVTKGTVGHIPPVPLFIKKPFQKNGRISDRPLETVDIVPTVADALRLSHVPDNIDGRSAFRKNLPRHRRRVTETLEVGSRLRERFRVAEMKYDMFSNRDGGLNLYQLGPGKTSNFVGDNIDQFTLTFPDTRTVSLKNSSEVENARPDMPLLPALLEGRLNGVDARAGEKIAVVLNDRVVAMTRTYRISELVRFYAMLPPKWFRQPPNELDIYLVEEASTRTLTPLPETNPSDPTLGD